MRAGSIAILMLGESTWRLLTRRGDVAHEEQIPAGDAARIAASLGAGGRVWLALPAPVCCSVRLTLNASVGADTRAARQSLLYEMEEKAPIVAEDVVADFVINNEDALAVSAATAPLVAAIDAIQLAGVAVGAISPLAVLAAEEVLHDGGAHDAEFVVVPEGTGQSLFHLKAGRLHAWHWLGQEPHDIAARVQLLRGEDPQAACRVMIVGDHQQLQPPLAAVACVAISHPALSPDALALATVTRLHATQRRPLIDLRRDRLAEAAFGTLRVPLAAALAAIVLLMLTLSAAFWISASRHHAVAAQLRERQQELYRTAFPDSRDQPRDIAARLASQRQLLGTNVGVGPQASRSPAALFVLRDLFTPIPEDGVFTLSRISIDEGRMEVLGQTPTHGDAARFAEALAAGGVFRIDPPQTVALRDGGVSFTLRGSVLEGRLSP